MSDKLVIVMPTCNEEENINTVLSKWYKIVTTHGENSEIVVVDDGSTDQTPELLTKFSDNHPKMNCLRQENKGHGIAVQEGYREALRKGADYIFQIDSDGQTDPDEFEKFWEIRKKYDAIIGWRKNRQDGLMRRFVASVLRLVLFGFFRVMVADANTPYRMIKCDALERGLRRLPENCVLTNAIMAALFVRDSFSVNFIEISFGRRMGGTNKMNIRNIIRTGIKAMKQMKRLR